MNPKDIYTEESLIMKSRLNRLEKFSQIVDKLKNNNIELVDIVGGNPVLEDKSCEIRLVHNIITWDSYSVDEVVDMTVKVRDNHIPLWQKRNTKIDTIVE